MQNNHTLVSPVAKHSPHVRSHIGPSAQRRGARLSSEGDGKVTHAPNRPRKHTIARLARSQIFFAAKSEAE